MNKFMKLAVEEARKAVTNGHGGPFGAVVVCNGQVIASAHNMVLSNNDPSAHAEIQAIRKACEVLGKPMIPECEIYSSCEPCPMCLAAIMWARIQTVYYGCTREDAKDAGFIDAFIYNVLEGREDGILNKINLDRDECLPVMEEWNHGETHDTY